MKGGALRGCDQHFGLFSLRHWHRREIVKELEIGVGLLEGAVDWSAWAWPFDPANRYQLLQDYVPERGFYDRITFARSTVWTLSVSFDREGNDTVSVPEFGVNAPHVLPEPDGASVR